MKVDRIIQYRLRVLELYGNDFIEAWGAVDVQFIATLLQVHGEEQAHQPQVVITVQVADEDVVDFMKRYLVAAQLDLYPLTTVDEEVTILYAKVL